MRTSFAFFLVFSVTYLPGRKPFNEDAESIRERSIPRQGIFRDFYLQIFYMKHTVMVKAHKHDGACCSIYSRAALRIQIVIASPPCSRFCGKVFCPAGMCSVCTRLLFVIHFSFIIAFNTAVPRAFLPKADLGPQFASHFACLLFYAIAYLC